VNFPDGFSVYGQEKIELVLLTKKQADYLNREMESYSLFAESFDNRFSPKNLRKIVGELDSVGLLGTLTVEGEEFINGEYCS
jgi:hypothetical protein